MTVDLAGWLSAPQRPDLVFLRRRAVASRRLPAPDRSEVVPPEPAGAVSGTSLDLGPVSVDEPEAPVGAKTPSPIRPWRRLQAPGVIALDRAAPMVALTRLQSGIGSLLMDAHSNSRHSIQLWCAYARQDGRIGTATTAGLGGLGLPNSLVVPVPGRHQRLVVDLRRVRELSRMLVFCTLDNGDGGPVLVSFAARGFGAGTAEVRARVEASGEIDWRERVLPLLSVYAVDGELVLRVEQGLTVEGGPEDACTAYGFDTALWSGP